MGQATFVEKGWNACPIPFFSGGCSPQEGKMDQTPHRVLDNICGGIVGAAEGLLRSGVNAVKGAGKEVIRALDTPVRDITGKEGPINMVDRVADGIVDAGENFVENGIVNTAKTAKEGVMRALDHPPEQIGFPPKLGMPQLFKKR
jgi:hypothetical protein